MTPQQRAKMEELAEDYHNIHQSVSGAGFYVKEDFIAGFTAALEMQSAEVEFDVEKCRNEIAKDFFPRDSIGENYVLIACRRQHDQYAAKIAQLQQEVERLQIENHDLKNHSPLEALRALREVDKAELAASQAQLARAEEALRFYAIEEIDMLGEKPATKYFKAKG